MIFSLLIGIMCMYNFQNDLGCKRATVGQKIFLLGMYARSSGLAFMGLHSRNGKRCIRVPGENVVGGAKPVEKNKPVFQTVSLFIICFLFTRLQ